jgi:hypothetical protein
MSVLERLGGEVRAAQQRREAEDSAEVRRAGVSIARLSPAVTRAARYLDDLAGHLNALERRIAAHYRLADVGVLGQLEQESYAVTGRTAPMPACGSTSHARGVPRCCVRSPAM